MKNLIKTTITTICAVVFTVNASAQHRSRGNEPMASNNAKSNNSSQKYYGNGNVKGNGNKKPFGNNNGLHPNVSINLGFAPSYGYNNYNNGYNNYGYNNSYGSYNNYYSSRMAARNALNRSANVIRQAMQFSNWNDMYSPWLAKAIRHQQYAKKMYYWGNYAGAINHSERAGFLAWNTLTYYNNSYGYNNSNNNGFNDDDFGYSNYQDPYQNPNNPYYKTATANQNGGSGTDNVSSDEDFGYKIAQTQNASTQKVAESNNTTNSIKKSTLDTQLPEAKMSDKELLKMNANDLDVE